MKDKKIYPCPEIIEFPVMVVDTHQAKRLDQFHYYIRPTLNKELSQFCTELTGITQQQVDGGIVIEEAI